MDIATKWEDDGGQHGGGGRRPMRMSGEGGGGGGNVPFSKMVFDGKRMRKAIQRRTVDYNHSVARWMQVRLNIIQFYYTNKIMLCIFIFIFVNQFVYSVFFFISLPSNI